MSLRDEFERNRTYAVLSEVLMDAVGTVEPHTVDSAVPATPRAPVKTGSE